MIQMGIDMPKIDAQIKALDGFGRSVIRHHAVAMKNSVFHLERKWKIAAPVDTGRYRGSIFGRVQIGVGFDREVIGVVKSPVQPYPLILEESERTHYRRGPRRGQPTKGHVKRVKEKAQVKVKGFFEQASIKIIKDLKV